MSPEKRIYTLSAILGRIRTILEASIKDKYFWLKVEIAKKGNPNQPHLYLELTETKEGQSIATCRATIWRSRLIQIKESLGSDFDNIIKDGNEILCYVKLEFTERFGLNIVIEDIDLNFNLGALEKKKQETLDNLKKDALIDKNKSLKLPAVIQKIAIIGSSETAGITDLIKQLKSNLYHYCFTIEVFSCNVQGDKAEAEIINRLKQLKGSSFDVIALVRGGGSKLDLEVFNSYNIAKEIALHDRPVFTGIGHETNISVSDIVANVYHKTPSSLGSYIVERARNFEVRFSTSYNYILEYKKHFMDDKWSKLNLNTQTLTSTAYSYTRLRRGELHTSMNRINAELKQLLNIEKNKISFSSELISTSPYEYLRRSQNSLLHNIELINVNSSGKIKQALDSFKFNLEYLFSYSKNLCKEKLNFMLNVSNVISIYHPDNILNKGYAIPRIKGELLTEQELKTNDELEIEIYKKTLLVSFIKYK